MGSRVANSLQMRGVAMLPAAWRVGGTLEQQCYRLRGGLVEPWSSNAVSCMEGWWNCRAAMLPAAWSSKVTAPR